MHRFFSLIAILLSLSGVAHAEPVKTSTSEGPQQMVQRFYDQYVKSKDSIRYIAGSHSVTPGFKKVFLAFMKDPDTDVDPIVEGQDVPPSGFKASKPDIKGTAATVVMTSSDPGFKQHIKVHLVFDGKAWLINGVDKLIAK